MTLVNGVIIPIINELEFELIFELTNYIKVHNFLNLFLGFLGILMLLSFILLNNKIKNKFLSSQVFLSNKIYFKINVDKTHNISKKIFKIISWEYLYNGLVFSILLFPLTYCSHFLIENYFSSKTRIAIELFFIFACSISFTVKNFIKDYEKKYKNQWSLWKTIHFIWKNGGQYYFIFIAPIFIQGLLLIITPRWINYTFWFISISSLIYWFSKYLFLKNNNSLIKKQIIFESRDYDADDIHFFETQNSLGRKKWNFFVKNGNFICLNSKWDTVFKDDLIIEKNNDNSNTIYSKELFHKKAKNKCNHKKALCALLNCSFILFIIAKYKKTFIYKKMKKTFIYKKYLNWKLNKEVK